MSTYNVDLMLAVREQITSHPETHNQSQWARRTECGTTLCIAGHTAALAGERLVWRHMYADFVDRQDEYGYPVSVTRAAMEHLGLSEHDACRLFSPRLTNAEALERLDELIEKGKNSA